MSNQLGINLKVEIDKNSSDESIKRYLDNVQKNKTLGIKIDTNSLAEQIKNLSNVTFDFDKNGVLKGLTYQIKTENGEILKIKQQLNKANEFEVRSAQIVSNAQKQQMQNEELKVKHIQQQRQLAIEINKLLNSKNGKYISSSELKRLQDLEKSFKNLNATSTKQLNSSLKDTKLSINEIANNANNRRLTTTVDKVNSLGQSLKNLGLYVSGAMIVRKLFNEFRDAVQHIKDVDSAFTNMSMTMESLTKNQFDEMMTKINSMSKEMGAVSSDVLKIAQTFANDSTSIEAVMNKLAPSTALMNISGMGATDVTKSIMSIANSYQMLEEGGTNAAEVTEYLGDVLAKVSANMDMDFQEGLQGLVSGIGVAGSTMKAAGVDMEWFVGQLGNAMVATGQTADKLGRGMRTITARVMQQKQALEELGESTENIELEFAKGEKALKELGITIRNDTTGQLKSFSSIMDELGGRWKGLSDSTKYYLAEQLAGKNQMDIFIGMMDSYENALGLVSNAYEAQGTLMDMNGEYADSLQGKLNTLTSTFQELYQNTINTDGFKGLIDGFTSLISGVNSFVKTVGSVPTLMGVLTASFVAFTKEGHMMRNMLVNIVKGLIGYATKTTTATTVTNASTVATRGLKLEIGLLQGVMTMGLSVAIGVIVGGLTHLIDRMKNSSKYAKEMADEISQSFSDIDSSIQKTQNADSLIRQYDNLTNKMNEGKLSTQELKVVSEELSNVKSKLLELFPTAIDGYDNEGNAILTNKENLEKLNEAEKENLRIQQEALKIKAEANYEDVARKLQEAEKKKKDIQDKIENARKQSQSEDVIASDAGFLALNELSEELIAIQSEISSYTGTLKIYDDVLGKTKEQQDEVKESTEEMANQATVVADAFRSISETAGGFDSSNIENATQEYVELANKARNIQAVIDEINKNGVHLDALDSAKEYMAGFTGNIGNASDVLKHLNEVLQSTNEETYLLYANLLSYDKSYWESANANSTEYFNNNIKNTNEWANFQQQIYNQLMKIDAIMNESKVANYDGYFSHVAKNMQTELANCKSLAEAKVKIETVATEAIMKQHREVANAMKSYGGYYDMKGDWVETSEYHEFDNYNGISTTQANQAISSILKWKENALASIQSMDALINTAPTFTSSIGNMSDALSGASKETEKLVADLEDIADAYYEINNALKDVENALNLNKAKQENSTGRKRVELMREEVELLKKKQRLLTQQQAEMGKERDALRKTLQNNGFSFSDDGSITNYQKRLKELQNWANSLSGDNKENAIESVEGLVDVIERYTELIKDEIPDVVQSWEEMTTAIKEAEREQLDYVTQVQKDITSAIENELRKRTDAVKKELQKQQDLYNSQYDEEDWNRELSDGQRKIDEIKAQINALSRDTSLAGQLKLEQLKNDLIEQETLFNDMIREHEKELGNNRFDEEISNLEDALEEQLTPENLASLVNQALVTGFVQIGDNVMELDTLMTKWLDDFGDGLYAIGDTLDSELIDQLVTAKELMNHIGITSLSNNTGMRSRTIDTNGINNGVNLSIGNLLSVDGNLTEDLLPQVEVMLRNASQELLNKISSQLSFR